MGPQAKIDYRPNPLRQGSRNRRGDQVDSEFVQYLLQLLGDVRALWLPGKSGTTLTDKSRHARVLTWSEEVSAFDTKPSELGSGYAVTLNGTDEEGDSPDTTNISFGDGSVDEAFSAVALIKPANNSSSMAIVGKQDLNIGEWALELSSSGAPFFVLTDDSAGATIQRSDATAFGTDWGLLTATYDGSEAVTGIDIYKDAVLVDDTDGSSGFYTAMENQTSLVNIGARYAVKERFFNGQIALIAVCAKALTIDEIWAVKESVNGYYGLSL